MSESPDTTEAMFRRAMSGATDRIWGLRLEEEALAALHDVIDEGMQRADAGRTGRDDVPQ
jgi:hypothetical protein